jgi:NAD(P)H-quinone oxidoreductase subunit 6
VNGPGLVLFYLFALLTVGAAAVVALSRNILHSAFSLLAAFTGVAGLFVLLRADFLAAAQVLIYVGGILVLILFAIMMTRGIHHPAASNESLGLWRGILLAAVAFGILVRLITATAWFGGRGPVEPPPGQATVATLGGSLLGTYLFPFELASVVLLAALVAAAVLVRKEARREVDPTAERGPGKKGGA